MFAIFLIISKTVISVCFVLGSIALVHEFGHYITAKLTGIWVIEFAIGFGNRLLKLKFGETIYSIRPFPLGGFVRLAGMDPPEEPEPEAKNGEPPNGGTQEGLSQQGQQVEPGGQGDRSEPSSEPPKEASVPPQEEDDLPTVAPDDPRGFPTKSRWVKALVLSAGSLMNLVWAVVLFVMIYALSGGPLTNIAVLDAPKDQPAYQAGVRAGDLIIAIDGAFIEDWNDGVKTIQRAGGNSIVLDVARDHPTAKSGFGGGLLLEDYSVDRGNFQIHNRETIKIKVVPSGSPGNGRIGISLAPNNFDFRVLSFGKAVSKGFDAAMGIISQTFNGLLKILTRETQADVAGPIKIMQMIKEQATKGLFELLYLTAILSINIGLINLMPLPVLDGGRIVFVLLESIFAFINFLTGLSLVITPKWEERVHFVGFLLLLVMLVLVTYQDIRNLL